jgi:hypothetical protein
MPGIARVLHHLGNPDTGSDQGRVDALVQNLDGGGVGRMVVADQRKRRLAEVCERGAFTKELRITETPKPSPDFLPDAASSAGIMWVCVVPGSTVLRTTTT